ncbi:MAG: thiolase family protein [Gammaproteobacteria bacterium]
MARNPIKDKVAIVGIGSTGFSRDGGGRSRNSLAAEAAVQAIRDAGLAAADIDGVVATAHSAAWMASALGLPAVTHYVSHPMPLVFGITDAMNAIFSGSADCVLVYHAVYRTPATSRSAYADPFRRKLGFGGTEPTVPERHEPESIFGGPGYTAWASRWAHEYGDLREALGRIAVNDRSGALLNPLAAMREPLTLEDYMKARMVREPLCILDMDVPVDGADAFVLTTAERARDLPRKPVYIHAATNGLIGQCQEDQTPGLHHHGQHVVIEELRAKSDIWIPDVDVYLPYDGFSFITLSWIENIGWCKPGEGPAFLRQHWDAAKNRLMINGRIPMNPHGGALSEGGTQGSGHIREAVTQLRGDAGARQAPGARTAFLTPGGFFFNAQGLVLRTD